MDAVFPVGFPSSTTFYLVIYVLTLVVHVAFMNYVLAGTSWLALTGVLFRKNGSGNAGEITKVLRDSMPLALSGTITAGIAPLLFLQILYKRPFYTANNLLGIRWLSILPVLIVGFYLLYVLKSRSMRDHTGRLLSLAIFGCFAWTGFTWTENHLLSVKSQEYQAAFYGSEAVFHFEAALVPRFLVWVFGAFATLAVLLGWQLRRRFGAGEPRLKGLPKSLARSALLGLALSAACAWWYLETLGPRGRALFTSDPALTQGVTLVRTMAQPWLVTALAAALVQAISWAVIWRKGELELRWLCLGTVGCLLTLVSVAAVRECLRIQELGTEAMASLQEAHARSGATGGWFAFILSFAFCASLMVWCLRQFKPHHS